MKLLPAGAIRVRLSDEAGAPVIGASVVLLDVAEAVRWDRPRWELGAEFTRSPKGVFGSVSLGGRHRVVATHEGRRVQSEPITLSAENPVADVELRFYPARAVMVRVMGMGDVTIANARLSVGRRDAGFDSWEQVSLRTDDRGEFRIEGLRRSGEVGCALYVAFERDWQPVWASFSGKESEPWVLNTKPGLRVTGRVVRADGSAVAGVRPMALPKTEDGAAGRPSPAVYSETITDDEGRFRFSNLPPGALWFAVPGRSHPPGGTAAWLNLPAANGAELRIVVE